MSNYDFKRTARKCSNTGRAFKQGEQYISALIENDEALERVEFAIEDWEGPPEDCVAWWKSTVPDLEKGKVYWAPRNVLITFFEHLVEQPGNDDTQFVMALLLVRKRILRLEDSIETESGESMILQDPREKKNYEVNVVELRPEQLRKIQSELGEQLFTDHKQGDDESGS